MLALMNDIRSRIRLPLLIFAVCIFGFFLSQSILLALSFALICVTAYLITDYRASAILVIIGSMLNGLGSMGSALLRPDYIAILVGLVSVAFFILKRNNRLYTGPEFWMFTIFFCYAVVVSIMVSPVFEQSKNGLFQLLLVFLSYFLIIQLQNEKLINISTLTQIYVGFIVLQAVYGLLSFMIYTLSGVNLGGVQFGQVATSVTIKGSLIEANLFGGTMALGLLIVTCILLHSSTKKIIWIIAYILLFIGLVLSWTRSAWIGFVLCTLLIALVYARKVFTPRMIFSVVIGLLLLSPIIYMIIQQIDSASNQSGLFLSKITNLFDSESGTGLYRVNQFTLALEDLKGHELFGTGYFSIKEYGEKAWISNMAIFIYHDTGVIGLLLLTGVVLTVLLRAITVYFRTKQDANKPYLLAMIAGLLLLLFTYNFTPGHTLSMFWVHLGITIVITNRLKKLDDSRGEA